MAALIVFNALYWPIGTDDALVIYAYYGKAIAASSSLPALHPGALYEAYPMALPLSEALIFQAEGWADTHLAALAPALLSIGTFGIAYLIGRTLVDRATGIAAALLIALTPLIAYWASASYTDLPAGFFYGFAWLFAIRYSQNRHVRDAILCGVLAGLAAWTKNSALLIIGSLGLWMIWLHTFGRAPADRRFAITPVLQAMITDNLRIGVPFLLICGGWYARAEIQAGWLVPPTGWTFAAQRTLGNLFPYLTDSRALPTGIIFTVGVLWLIVWAIRSRMWAFVPIVLLISTLPFMLIWYLLFLLRRSLFAAADPTDGGGRRDRFSGDRQVADRPVTNQKYIVRVIAVVAILIMLISAGAAALLYKNELIY